MRQLGMARSWGSGGERTIDAGESAMVAMVLLCASHVVGLIKSAYEWSLSEAEGLMSWAEAVTAVGTR